MSFLRFFLPDDDILSTLSYKEREKIANLVIGSIVCIPGFIILSLVLIFLYKFKEIGALCFLPSLCFLSALSCLKIGKVKLASYFATFGFSIATFFITFFAPSAEDDKLSSFVCYRTCAFCVCLSIINYIFSLRKFQLVLFHLFSLGCLLISSITVYKPNYDKDPILMISAIIINFIGIFAANIILVYSWKFYEKVLEHSEMARAEIEDLNRNLENKVIERTRELSESNQNLENANRQLEEINARSERDMNLAVNVQRSFYPTVAPEVDGWEISYIFQPMAGVSGDLYDFYTDGKKFEGCCLFDVSGHGISSGLVTMLSKTIIAREFANGKNKSLAKVMLSVNDSIISDKGDIENYLTGVILRVDGNVVEYVNGGHPSLLCRSGSTGKVIPAKIDSEDADGSVVGVQYLPASYTGIKFNVKSGDSLMIYTDCLYESRNEEGEQFGEENVSKIFSQVGNGTAQDQLSRLIKYFKNYTGNVPLNDDLTVIILKKL